MRASDQGFLLALLGIACAALAIAHVSLRAATDRERGFHLAATRSGCDTCHSNLEEVHPRFGDHRFDLREPHRVFAACTDCHAGDARGRTFAAAGHAHMAKGEAQDLRCVLCHSPRKAATLSEGRARWAKASCGSCHQDFHLSGERKGPSLDKSADKLTREWTYRYLLEPESFDDDAAPGMHGISGSGDDPRVKAKILALAVFTLDGARTRKSDTWRAPAATPDPARFQALMRACKSCHNEHAFAGQGTKTNAAWLAAFLRMHVKASPEEADQLALGLATRYHPTFEGRWPVMSRALEDELRALAETEHVPDTGPMDTWLKALGAALFTQEGCAQCHEKAGTAPAASVPLRKPLERFDRTHRPLRDDRALRHYVDALLVWEHDRRVDLTQ